MHPILFTIPIQEHLLHTYGPLAIGVLVIIFGLLYYLSRQREPNARFELKTDGPVILVAGLVTAAALSYTLTYRGGDFDFYIYTYGPIMALAFLVAFGLVVHLVRRSGEDLEFFSDLYLWLIVVGVAGAKVLFIFTELRDFLAHPLDLINCRKGGLVWYGGVIANLIFIYFYCRRQGKSFVAVTDLLIAPLALGLAIGRIGCLMGGCCYGKACTLPWAITYPSNPMTLSIPPGLPVHPSPLYELLGALIIAGLCYLAFTRSRRRALPTLTYFTLYPLLRFFLEYYRGDVERKFVIPGVLSTSQFIGILVLVPALVLLILTLQKPLPEPQPQSVETPAPSRKKKKKKH